MLLVMVSLMVSGVLVLKVLVLISGIWRSRLCEVEIVLNFSLLGISILVGLINDVFVIKLVGNKVLWRIIFFFIDKIRNNFC